MDRIGILGGTFNPVHTGHLAMAEMAREKFRLEKVIFVPAHTPPHKKIVNIASPQHRFEMVRLAVKSNPYFEVSDFEINRPRKSYTVDTVRYLQGLYPQAKLYLIIGEDSYPQLAGWKFIEEVLEIASIITVNRPGYHHKEDGIPHNSVTMPGLEISSSYLRQRLAQGKAIKYLVPETVFRYIEEHELYRGKGI